MRIVSGKHKGRPLNAPKGRDTRPTSDRAREAIFNVLEHGISGPGFGAAAVLDVFAGTGALGLEAISRGASHCTFVEMHSGARRILNDNIQTLGETISCVVLDKKAQSLSECLTQPVDYAFLDAPYHKNLSVPALNALSDNGWLKDQCVVMVEIAKDEELLVPPKFIVQKEKNYGAARAVFLIYRA